MNTKINKSEVKVTMFKKGLDLNSLSRKLEVDVSYLSLIINGKRNPSPKLAKRIAETLGVEITDIFTIETNKEAN